MKALQCDRRGLRGHEAIIVPSAGGNTKGTIFYNPDLPLPRIIFSIGHEITHSFFPASTTGARFRNLSRKGSKGARELEMLCHAGASELTMPSSEFCAAVKRLQYRARHANGSWVSLEVVAYNLLDDPAVRGVVVNGRDVSKRQQEDSAKDQLIADLQQTLSQAHTLTGPSSSTMQPDRT